MNQVGELKGTSSVKISADQRRAMRLQSYGGADALKADLLAAPAPGSGEVLVQVTAAGVNGIDWKIRQGFLRDRFKLELPATLGIEMAGVVVQVGDGVEGWAQGDRVLAALGGVGAYTDYLLIDAAKLVRTPAGLSDVAAGAIPVAAMTAWHVVHSVDFDLAGRTVLIHGAAGGVGGFALQFAKAAGARVIATASTNSVAHVETLGADMVIDYRQSCFETLAGPVDLVLDLVGGDVVDRSWSLLKSDGQVRIHPPGNLRASRNSDGPIRFMLMVRKPVSRFDQSGDRHTVIRLGEERTVTR